MSRMLIFICSLSWLGQVKRGLIILGQSYADIENMILCLMKMLVDLGHDIMAPW